MELGLNGRRVLVTGASKGIGRACAEVFAAEGCTLDLVSRTAADLDMNVEVDRGAGGKESAAGPDSGIADKPQSTRSGGYGSGSGLGAEDPAYRMEERSLPAAELPPGDDTILGGDERRDPEAEHL